MRHARKRARIGARLLGALVFLPLGDAAFGEDVVPPVSATNAATVDPIAVLRRSPTAPPRAALFVETTPGEMLEAFALTRGMNVLRLDPSKVTTQASSRDALVRLVARYRRETGATRIIAHGDSGAASALLASGFDGVLLEGIDGAVVNGAARIIAVVGADFFLKPVPPARSKDAAAANVRRFYLTGVTLARGADCAPPKPVDSAAPALRALLVALDDWTKGAKPPASRFPGDADLVDARARVWPDIPGFAAPPSDTRRVPAIDADGNERPVGLTLPDRALPIATFTAFGPGCVGVKTSPFAGSKAEREKIGDPRPSLVERYGSRAYFVATMRVVADRLVRARLLLSEDADAYVAAAKTAPF
jgi:hypothetical protein